MSGKLDNIIIYLAGPMQEDLSGGVGYRSTFKTKCIESGLKIKFLDPTKKLTSLNPDVYEEKNTIEKLIVNKNWPGLRSLMKTIVKQDLRQVDLCDLVVAFIDKSIYTCGTFHEIINCENERKLVLLVVRGGKAHCPAWLFGIIHYDFIFDSDEEVVSYLVKLNDGTIPLNDKLILFRKELDSYNP